LHEVAEIPVEVLLAMETDGCQRFAMQDGEVVQVGRWVVLREFAEGEGGEPVVVSMRAFRFASPDDADETLQTMLAEEGA
jgi:hypothetical protein